MLLVELLFIGIRIQSLNLCLRSGGLKEITFFNLFPKTDLQVGTYKIL